MKVLAIVPCQKGHSPGQRGSIELWEKALAPAGIELHYAPFESDRMRAILYASGHHFAKAWETAAALVKRLGILKRLDEFDAVFIYREAALLGPALLERLIARKKPIIYQLDDPLYMPYKSQSNGYLSYLKFFGKIKEIIKLSKVVIVNSSFIREYAAEYNQNIRLVPSIVDEDLYQYIPAEENPGRVCIGWSGSYSTVGNLKMLGSAFSRLRKTTPFDLFLIGGTDFDLPGTRYRAKKWRLETEVEDLRQMHIGLIPLPVNEWNKRKFIMKTSQYMCLGIPPVGTPMASNNEFIVNGETGFLADNEDEWFEYLRLLAEDHELRNKIALNVARLGHEKFTLKANKETILQAFQSALA
jgi:glycosyltransferase involved in cell wall biosynthesis